MDKIRFSIDIISITLYIIAFIISILNANMPACFGWFCCIILMLRIIFTDKYE